MRPAPLSVNLVALDSCKTARQFRPMNFASDNTSGIPAPILSAVTDAAKGYAPGYGADDSTTAARDLVRDVFDAPQAEIALVPTGSAANALALACYCPPWGAVLCHKRAHINVDECGAPEFFTNGAKLVALEGPDATISLDALRDALTQMQGGGVHQVRPSIVSLTNLTECGTVLTPTDIAARAELAKRHGLAVHLDGARFANALATTGASPADMTWRAGVDVLSLGGTKNGLMGVEAVVLFDPARAGELALRRKRAGQLLSKHRYLSAQLVPWLTDGYWLTLARHANAMAAALEAGLRACDVPIRFARGGNMIFADLTPAQHHCAQTAGARYYLWPDHAKLDGAARVTARLVMSWSTTQVDVAAFLSALDG
jgi:threonine aldolase